MVVNRDVVLNLMLHGGYLEDKGEAEEPRDLSQCSGPESLFVNFL